MRQARLAAPRAHGLIVVGHHALAPLAQQPAAQRDMVARLQEQQRLVCPDALLTQAAKPAGVQRRGGAILDLCAESTAVPPYLRRKPSQGTGEI